MPAKDGPVITAMRDLSSQYPRYAYRRIHICLDRRGLQMSPDRAHRLWQLAGCKCRESGLGGAWRAPGRARFRRSR